MSDGTPVCQPKSVRRCCCRACKPRKSIVRGNKKLEKKSSKFICKCETDPDFDQNLGTLSSTFESLISFLSSSSEDSDEELPESLLSFKRCECLSCKPVLNERRKRLCTCIGAKLVPVKGRNILKGKKEKDIAKIKRVIERRRTVIKIIEESSELINKRNKPVIENNITDLKFSKEKLVIEFEQDNNNRPGFSNSLRNLFVKKKAHNNFKYTKKATDLIEKSVSLEEEGGEEEREQEIISVTYEGENIEMGDIKPQDKNLTAVVKPNDDEEEDTDIIITEDKHLHRCAEKKPLLTGFLNDPNIVYYSKFISEHDANRIIYGVHRLLHNYVMFRCDDPHLAAGILNERFIEKMSLGFEVFLKDAYLYDEYYQPISFKRRYGYIELHLKVGVDDMFANKHRMFKKVFLVIFLGGSVKFLLTKYSAPKSMIEKEYEFGIKTQKCRDVWCRVDFISSIVHRRHRRIKHRVIETLYDTISADEKGFYRLTEPLDDLWTCIDFDTESESWSKTERGQFIKQMRYESDPYIEENRKKVPELETKLEKERRRAKRHADRIAEKDLT